MSCLAAAYTLNLAAQEHDVNSYTISTNLLHLPEELPVHFELPPVIYSSDEPTVIATTHYSAQVNIENDIANFDTERIQTNQAYSYIATPLTYNGSFEETPYLNVDGLQHKRNYNGIFSVHDLPNNKGVIAIHHGENKNELRNGILFQNSVLPSAVANADDTNSYSGMINGRYKEDWDSYFAFLNASFTFKNNLEPLRQLSDIGPVVWPSHGYLTQDGKKASYGLRHPTSIVHDNFLYIFYSDSKHPNIAHDADRMPGKKLARVHIDSTLFPHSYKVYFNGGWENALPEGFNKFNIEDFYAVKGPKSTPLFKNSGCMGRFSVAKVKGENYFISVEEYRDKEDGYKTKIAIRYSFDLIHWTQRENLPNCTWDKWIQGNMHYPVFLNKDGSSTTEVDLEEFYIIGTSSVNKDALTRKRFQLKPKESLYSPNGKKLDLHQMAIFPNPTKEEAFVHLNNPEYENIQVTITDKRGNIMYRSSHSFTFENWNKPFKLNLENLSHGIYFINVKGVSFLQQSKIIIK